MILIINQHRGEFQELVDHLNNFIEKCTAPDKFHLSLRVDQPISDEERFQLWNLVKKYYNISICGGDRNVGLSSSRELAFMNYKDTLKSKPSEFYPKAVIFGATNTKYTRDLDETLYEDLISLYNRVTLLPCEYKKDPFTRDLSYVDRDQITFPEYINWEDKPDYSLMFPFKEFVNCDLCYWDEKYYPEELIIHEVIERSKMHLSSYELNILPYSFIEAWYNDDGLSKNFNRQFMIDNRLGFSRRAEVFLHDFDTENFPLTLHRLKYFIYDYVTLSGEVQPHRQFKSEVIHSLCFNALARWISNPDHQHGFKFIENNE